MPSPRLEKGVNQKPPKRSGGGISPSGSRLSRAGARADKQPDVWESSWAGDYNSTLVSADQFLIREAVYPP